MDGRGSESCPMMDFVLVVLHIELLQPDSCLIRLNRLGINTD